MGKYIIFIFLVFLNGCIPVVYVQSINEIHSGAREHFCWEIYLRYPSETHILSCCNLCISDVLNITCLNTFQQSDSKTGKAGPVNEAITRKEDGEAITIKAQARSSNNNNGICKNIIYYDYQQRRVGGNDLYLIFTRISNWNGTLIVSSTAKMFEWEKLKKSQRR